MSAPVPYTCPDIDALISNVKALLKLDSDVDSDDLIYEIRYRLSNFECELENLRNSNSELRSWGEELEDKIEKIKDIL